MLPPPVACDTIIIIAKIISVDIIGISQYSLRFHKKLNSSLIMPIRAKIVFMLYHPYFLFLRTRYDPSASMSMSLFWKVFQASRGEVTIGSPRRLNDVFKTI